MYIYICIIYTFINATYVNVSRSQLQLLRSLRLFRCPALPASSAWTRLVATSSQLGEYKLEARRMTRRQPCPFLRLEQHKGQMWAPSQLSSSTSSTCLALRVILSKHRAPKICWSIILSSFSQSDVQFWGIPVYLMSQQPHVQALQMKPRGHNVGAN